MFERRQHSRYNVSTVELRSDVDERIGRCPSSRSLENENRASDCEPYSTARPTLVDIYDASPASSPSSSDAILERVTRPIPS